MFYQEVTEPKEEEDVEETNENLDPDESKDEDSWDYLIDIAGKWRLDYTIETNHDGIHVGTEKRIDATEYDYTEYVFKEDNTFIETISQGESSENVEVSIREGTYKAGFPPGYTSKYLELRYEDGDWASKAIELNSDKTTMKVDAGGYVDMDCGCSEDHWEYDEYYDLVD